MTRERAMELANATRVNAFGEHSSSAIADVILAAVAEEREALGYPKIVIRESAPDACPNCHAIPPNKHAWGCPVAQPLDVVVR